MPTAHKKQEKKVQFICSVILAYVIEYIFIKAQQTKKKLQIYTQTMVLTIFAVLLFFTTGIGARATNNIVCVYIIL